MAAGYVELSVALSGDGGFSLAIIFGMVVALTLAGVRRSAGTSTVETKRGVGEKDAAEKKVEVKVEGQEGRGETNVDQGLRSTSSVELEIEPSDALVDEVSSPRQDKEVSTFSRCEEHSPPTVAQPFSLQQHVPYQPQSSVSSPAVLWEQARVMVHNVIPNFFEDAEYLNLVFSAAEQGHVPALAKLGDYAFRRCAFVEAYFWTRIAKRRLELAGEADKQGMREIDAMLQNIRREWAAAGQPPEFENVYENFPIERGELGRVFLQLDSRIQTSQAREYIRALAKKGNPDAALFVS